jgi:lysozyme
MLEVVDLYAPEGVESWAKIKGDGVHAVIHKATEGIGFTDAQYTKRRGAAREAGLLWGSYHFGTASDPEEQARNFLDVVEPGSTDLIVLDLELNEHNKQNTMSISQAEKFVTYVYEEIGRWPGLYAGYYLREHLAGKPNPTLSNCWLWLADWGTKPHLLPGWSEWKLWQFTGGEANDTNARDVAGLYKKPDLSYFNGTEQELKALFGAA